MTEAIHKNNEGSDTELHPRMRSYAPDDATFLALVERSKDSAKRGKTRAFESIDAEILRLLPAN